MRLRGLRGGEVASAEHFGHENQSVFFSHSDLKRVVVCFWVGFQTRWSVREKSRTDLRRKPIQEIVTLYLLYFEASPS